MRAWAYIVICTLLAGVFKAQVAVRQHFSQSKNTFLIKSRFQPFTANTDPFVLHKTTVREFGAIACFNPEPAKLPFFCSMENKFRNRFHLYLKLRAGNDEMYRALITTSTRQP